MLIKILGCCDLLAAFFIFALAFGVSIPKSILIFFIAVLLAKSSFIITRSLAAGLDLFAAFVLILSFYFLVPYFIFFLAGIFLLQKGFLSLI